MKKLIPFLLVFIGCKQTEKHVTGLLMSDSLELRNLPAYVSSEYAAVNKGVGTTIEAVALPASVRLDMPPVMNQGGEGSCASMAVINVRSAEQYYRTSATAYDTSLNVFSPEYLYNQCVAGGCSAGSSISSNTSILQIQGVCTWASMPYSSLNGCSLQPNAAQKAEAANYKITSVSQVYSTDETAVKTMLYNKHPLIAQVSIDNNFANAKPGYLWNSFGTFVNNHAVALCGYDDTKNAYLLVNSFGTSWGDAGYLWVDYAFFKTVSYSLIALNLDPVPCPASGTLLRTTCTGVDKYGVYANGTCGEYTVLIQANSTECGYVPPADTEKPVVTITTPPDGYKLTRFIKALTINATATDNVGIVSMSITVNGVVTNCTGGNCSYMWNVKNLPAGSYVITATAKDKAGNAGFKTITIKK